jgi:hypothetical protein
MKTIGKSDFMYFFMDISEKLTLAEVRLLYLLITEPNIIEASQQEIANIIGAHRRTVNLGLKKLKQCQCIEDVNFEDRKMKMANYQAYTKNDKSLTDKQKVTIKQIISDLVGQYYRHDKKGKNIINEDFYCSVLGDLRLPESIRYDKEYITNYVKESFPNYIFYFNLRKSSFVSTVHYKIIHRVNSELFKARRFNRFHIDRKELIKSILEYNPISEEGVLKVIKENFPLIIISKNRLSIHSL